MNFRQRFVVFVGVSIMAWMGVYPPWVHIRGIDRRYAYGWIFNPPPRPMRELVSTRASAADFFGGPKPIEPEPGWRTEIDLTRLLIQWAVVALVAGGLALADPVLYAILFSRFTQHLTQQWMEGTVDAVGMRYGKPTSLSCVFRYGEHLYHVSSTTPLRVTHGKPVKFALDGEVLLLRDDSGESHKCTFTREGS